MELFQKIADFASHSCFPNCGINSNNRMIALRPMASNEPVTIDFATLFLGDAHTFECNCGHVGCRKIIRGFNFLPERYQEYYLGYDAVSKIVVRDYFTGTWPGYMRSSQRDKNTSYTK